MCKLKIYQASEYTPLVMEFEDSVTAATYIGNMSSYCKVATRFELIVCVGEESGDE